jgi:hypothetical protein
MDHIPYPTLLGVPAVTVPYLAMHEAEAYSLDFTALGARLSIATHQLSPPEFASNVQAWLYFGFLETFVGEKVDRERFRREPTKSEISHTVHLLDSSFLPILLNKCTRKFRNTAHRQDRAKQLHHWASILETAGQCIQHLERHDRTSSLCDDETCAAIFLSIRVLEVTLRDFYCRMDHVKSARMKDWARYPTAMHRRMPGFRAVLYLDSDTDTTLEARLLIKYVQSDAHY